MSASSDSLIHQVSFPTLIFGSGTSITKTIAGCLASTSCIFMTKNFMGNVIKKYFLENEWNNVI